MTDFFYQFPRSIQHGIALAILFVIPLILFFDSTLGGKDFARHDTTQWRAGAQSIIEYRREYKQEPLWASNMFGGMPSFVISTQNQVRHLDRYMGKFRHIYPAFQYWVMLSGMYLLLVLMRFRPLSAVMGSLLFSLTTYFPIIIMAGHVTKFFTLALVPWTIAGYWLMTRYKSKRLWGLLLFTVAMALEIRASHPQITYYFMFLIGALWLFDSYAYIKEKKYKIWGMVTAFLIIGGVMGILGNAERTLSQQAYAEHSIRGGSDLDNSTGLDENYAFAWSQGVSETLTLLIPNVYGGASPEYWGPKSFTSGPHYLGALSLVFIVLALFLIKNRLMYIFFGVGTLAVLFSWGGNFRLLNHLAFEYIPYFNKFRAPETWLVVTAFCFSVVSVYGLDALLDVIKEKRFTFKHLYPPLGTSIGVFVVLFLFANSLDFTKTGEVESISYQIAQQNQVNPNNPQVQQRARQIVVQQFVPQREEKAKTDIVRLGVFLVIGIGLVYGVSIQKIAPAIAGFGFILLVSYDLINVGHRYMDERKFVETSASIGVNLERQILSQRRDIDQYIQENISKDSMYPYRVLPLLDNYFSNAIPAYFYPSLGGYSGAKLSVAQNVLAPNGPLFNGEQGLNIGLLELLNTKYITYTPGMAIDGITPVFTGQSGVVYELDNVLPKAFFVDSVITTNTANEAYNFLSSNIDFSTTAVVENYAPTIQSDPTASVEVTEYTGAEMTLKISKSAPGFLVLSEDLITPMVG